MTVGNFNGKPKSTALANSQFLGVDANGIFQTVSSTTLDVSLVERIIANNDSEIVFKNIGFTGNEFYCLFFKRVVSVNNDDALLMRTSNDGGSTWSNTGYLSGLQRWAYNGGSNLNFIRTTEFILSVQMDNTDSIYSCNGFINIYPGPANRCFINGQVDFKVRSPGVFSFCMLGGTDGQNGANAFRLFMDSGGNIQSGIFSLYKYS